MNKKIVIRCLGCVLLSSAFPVSSPAQSDGCDNSALDKEIALQAVRNSRILSTLSGAEEITLRNKQTWLVGVGRAALNVASKRSETSKQELLRVAQFRAAANILKLSNTQLTSISRSDSRFQASSAGEGDKVSFEQNFSEKIRVHAFGNMPGLSDLGSWESGGSVFVAVGTRIR
jgi:hypothetical protein